MTELAKEAPESSAKSGKDNLGRFTKGNPGKPKGTKEKTGRLIRDMITEALDKAGGAEYLLERAMDPKTQAAFLTLVGKTLPLQVTGEGGGAVQQVLRVELVAMDAKRSG